VVFTSLLLSWQNSYCRCKNPTLHRTYLNDGFINNILTGRADKKRKKLGENAQTSSHANETQHTHTHTRTKTHARTRTHTQTDFTEARDSEWQRHQLGQLQVCTLLQTDNHSNTPPLCFLQAGCPSCRPTNSVKALKAQRNSASNRRCG